ncbi:plasmid mobilization protein [Simplicispira lacusdiani]|uniref:plasmid mobilization protein n=1 Tax=Simplicispira lacusdiani TaxID=2213010 RepID=UPI001300B46C|nr:hypothetical protein [Simplicispira lacusdiani]
MAQPLLPRQVLRERFDLYLNEAEREAITTRARRLNLPVSTYIRKAALSQRIQAPPPALNIKAWQEAARWASNLNQLAHAIASGNATGVDATTVLQLSDAVRALRLQLLTHDAIAEGEST